jgi:hypothetical protein
VMRSTARALHRDLVKMPIYISFARNLFSKSFCNSAKPGPNGRFYF